MDAALGLPVLIALIAVALLFEFLVELRGFGHGHSGGAIFFKLLGCWPVDQRFGEFLPVIALRAQVAHTVAFYLIFRDELVGTVFEDEAPGQFLGGRERGTSERENGEDQGSVG